jgi:hypothetical protein
MPKKDSTWRMWVDSCTINRIIIKYYFSIPRIDEMFENVASTKVFFPRLTLEAKIIKFK